MQVELGFENGVVDDIFFVPGYDIRGSVVAQVLQNRGLHEMRFCFWLIKIMFNKFNLL